MKTHAEPAKSSHATTTRSRKRSSSPFFQQAHDETPGAALTTLGLQTKLRTGRRGDRFEREADSMADMVVGGQTAPAEPQSRFGKISPFVQRQAEDETAQSQAEEEPEVQSQEEEEVQPQEEEEVQSQAEEEVQSQEEEEVQSQEEEEVQSQEEEEVQSQAAEEQEEVQTKAEEEEDVQTKASGPESTAAPPGFERDLRGSGGRGSPLLENVRTKMESSFGADFSGIRIHTDDAAVQLTRLLNAKAFAHGRDLYFGEGNFSPGTRDGEHLLAHELTHTIQQDAAGPKTVEPEAPTAVQRQEDDDGATIMVRPEILDAIRFARGQIGKVNAKVTTADGTRLGWEHLYDYFHTAFGDKDVIHQDVIKFIKKVQVGDQKKDAMPSWCGIFVWWSYKTAGIPIPDWKIGGSILGWVTTRKPGELPQKGDIAYRDKNDHFALVTGVESPETAEGKAFKSIQVATVNGNTSGTDNLGGQVEEKWEPMSRWLAFFDPIAKLGMPPVPLVETSVEPDEVGAESGAEDGATADAAEAVEPAPPTDVSDLQESEMTTPSEAPAEGESEVGIDLPEPGAPTPETVAPVEKLDLEGSSESAMSGFTKARPSQMAATQPSLGESLDGKIKDEKADEVENAPVLTAQTSGTVEEGLTPPDQIPVPGDAELGDGVSGPDPGDLDTQPHENVGAVPSNAENEKLLDKQEQGGGLLDWLRNNIKSFMSNIRTADPGVNTSAGERPNVELVGEADPGRMDTQRSDAATQLKAQRDTTTDSIKNHPGQQNIQPKEIKEDRTVALTPETAVTIETQKDQGVADYVDAPLSADVRTKADDLLQTDLHANLSEAQKETDKAAQKREQDKVGEVQKAETAAAAANEKADKDQRDIVVKNRTDVANQQKTGIEDAYAEVNTFNTEADTEQVAARKEVGEKVKDTEGKARTELDKGEADAAKKKEEGEKDAKAKKKEMEEGQKKDSWWDRAVSAVKSAVKAITSAIDTIFTAVRDAVKTLIDAAKNAAVGLINAARDWVVDKMNKFRDWAKGMVDKYLKDRFPGLAAAINKGIDVVVDVAIAGVNLVADAAIATVEALADALAAALDKILSVYQAALKAAVQIAGAVLTGDFAEALRIAIRAACDIAGVDSKPIFDFLDRAAASVMKILKDPASFFNNLVTAVGNGIRSFVKNIKQHLIKGLIGWLTGALSEANITLPDKFDFKGILSLVMQILGLTYENIKARVIKKYPKAAKVFDLVEKGFAIVKKLVTEGPMALWEEVKQNLSNLKEMVISGIRTFIITTIIKEGIVWLISLLNPAGALAKIAKLLFDFVMFLIERFQQIKDFVLAVYESITAIANGVLTKASKAVEDALARSVPVVISLLASLAGLSGIGKTIKELIGKVTTPINKVIDKVIDKIGAFVTKLLGKGKAAAKKVKEKLFEWWKVKTSFKAEDGESHSMQLKGTGTSAKLSVKSEEKLYTAFINSMKTPEDDKRKAALAKAKPLVAKIEAEIAKKAPAGATDAKKKELGKAKKKAIEKHLKALKPHTAKLFADEMPKWQKPDYGGTQNDFGVSMKGEVLTLKGKGDGSAPYSEGGNWTKLNKRRQASGASYYIRGHLLNDNLGGKGNWENMTPLSRSGNSQHEKDVESRIKSEVGKGNIVKYYVEPVYAGWGGGSDIISQAGAGLAKEDRESLEDIVETEKFVPTELKISAELLKTKSGGGVESDKKLPVGNVKNPISRTPGSYFLGAKKLDRVNINTFGSAADLTAFGDPTLTSFATKIADASQKKTEDFTTYADVDAAIGSPGITDKLQGWSNKKWIRLKT